MRGITEIPTTTVKYSEIRMTLQSASDLLKRAVELDTALKYSESLICYEEGIQMLIRLMRGEFITPITVIERSS